MNALDIGPQSDGTNLISDISYMPQPQDTAGGQPADYSQSILDVFKFGVGAWSQSNAQAQMFDYKKFEATNGGLYRQGQTALIPLNQAGGGISSTMLLGIGAVILFAFLTHKG